MASKKSSSKSIKSAAKAVSSTAIRNTAIPKISAAPAAAAVVAAPRQITHEMIAQRAYEIWSNRGGDEQSNWIQAESELRTAA